MKPFYLYILKCNDNSYYIGHTDELEKRINQHSTGQGCLYTANKLPIQLMYFQEHPTRTEALIAERKIKKWSRAKKEMLISKGWAGMKHFKNQKNNLNSSLSFDSDLGSHTFARSPLRMTGGGSGILIALEGIDGSGKSVLAKNLYNYFAKHTKVLLTKEPGGSDLGKQLRTILQEHTQPIDPKAEFLLFAADRAQHFTQVIIPHLQQNYMIISDRMADSSLVYQGYGRGLDKDIIKKVNAWAMQNIKPDLTVYVQIDAATAAERFTSRNTKLSRFEQEKTVFFEKLIAGYNELYQHEEHVIIIDGSQSPAAVAAQAQQEISKRIA